MLWRGEWRATRPRHLWVRHTDGASEAPRIDGCYSAMWESKSNKRRFHAHNMPSNDLEWLQPFVKAGQLASVALEAVALPFRLYHEASRETLISSHHFTFFQSDEAVMENLNAHWVEGLPQTTTLVWIEGELSGWNSAILWGEISYRKVFFEELEWDVGRHGNRRFGDEGWQNLYRDRVRDSKQWFFHGYVASLYREDFKDWWAGRIVRQVNGSIERSYSWVRSSRYKDYSEEPRHLHYYKGCKLVGWKFAIWPSTRSRRSRLPERWTN